MNCFNFEYVPIKHNVLHNIEKVFGKYIFYSYMFDTEDSKIAMSRHPPTHKPQTKCVYTHTFIYFYIRFDGTNII